MVLVTVDWGPEACNGESVVTAGVLLCQLPRRISHAAKSQIKNQGFERFENQGFERFESRISLSYSYLG